MVSTTALSIYRLGVQRVLLLCLISCFSCCAALLYSAEAHWEFPSGIVPNVQIQVPLKITNFGDSVSKWEPPSVPDVQWSGIRRGGNYAQIINGVKTEEQTIIVSLSFAKDGSYAIPPVTLYAASGAQISTEPITVTVDSAHAFEANGDAYATASLSSEHVLPNQLFTLHYSIGFRSGKNLAINNQLGIQLPDACVRQGEIKAAKPHSQYAKDGSLWLVTDYSIDLKIKQAGSYTFTGQQSYGQIQQHIFSNMYNEIGQLPIKPATLEVMTLPSTNQPADFSGLIGSVDLHAALDRERVPMGKNVILSVTASNGQIDMLGALQLAAIDGLTVYQSDSETDAAGEHKTYTWTLVPKRPGTYTIPALTLAYFDPTTMRYAHLQSQPLTLTVIPGAQRDLGLVGAAAAPNAHATQSLAPNSVGMLLPSPFYGQANRHFAAQTNWLTLAAAFLIGATSALFVTLSVRHFAGRDKRGQQTKKAALQALHNADLSSANQQLHRLLPYLDQASKAEAQSLINAVEQARFGQQALNPQLIAGVKHWTLL